MKKRIHILFLFCTVCASLAFSQRSNFSIATELGVQRSLKKEQQFWAVGQTLHVHFHPTPKDGAYFWIFYSTNGKFKNDLDAVAKSPSITPQEIHYTNDAAMRFKQISMGWKHYLKGSSDAEQGWNLYGYAGFGLVLGRVINTHFIYIDTAFYNVPVLIGKANFKRLTLDLGLGWELPIGADIFYYTEGRLWIPTTDYPSKYIFINKNAPLIASISFGVRFLFD